MKAAARQRQIFVGGDHHQVAGQLEQDRLLRAARPPGRLRGTHKETSDLQEKDPAVLAGADIHQHDFIRQHGVGLRKEAARADMAQDRAVSPYIIALDRDAAGEDQAHAVRHRAGVHKDAALFKILDLCVQFLQAELKLLLCHSAEQGGF